jgi:hypothetical protein
MVAPWNPNAPGVLGLEWRPIVPLDRSMLSGPVAQRLRSRSAETITGLRWPVRGTATRDQHMMIVDIFTAGNENPFTTNSQVKQIEYSPNADTFNGGWYRRIDGLTTNLFQKIDENPVQYPPVRTDLGIQTATGAPTQVRFRVASGAFPLTARVLRLEYRLVVAAAGYEWRDTDYRLYWAGAGGPTVYNIPGSHIVTHIYGKLVTLDLGEINPQTLAPWTPADVRAFSTASGFELRAEGVGNPVSPVHLLSMSLRVTYQEVENRLAAAIWRRPATEFTLPRAINTDKLITLPGGAANWAKANAVDYTLLHRMAADHLVQYVAPRSDDIRFELVTDPGPSNRQPRRVGEEAFADVPIPGMAGAAVTLDQWGRPARFNDANTMTNGMSPTRQVAFMLIKSGPTVSEDSQPYGYAGKQISWQNKAWTGHTQYEELTPGATATYLGVDFIAIPPATVESTLTVQVTTTAGANVGGAFAITRAQALALPDLYAGARRITGFLASGAALTSGTAYRITFSSNAASETEGWGIGTAGAPDSLYAADGMTQPDGDLATFQAATGRGTYKDTLDSAIDLMVTLAQQPSIPTAAAAIVNVTNASPPEWCQVYCFVAAFEAPEVTWTAGAYTGFREWQVEREESTAPGVWVRLATITSEATKVFRDYAARRTYAVRYRVRAVLNTGAWSDWSTTVQVTPQPKGAEVIFASDADPSLTVAYDRDPEVTYQFLNSEEDTFFTLAGQSYQTVFGTPQKRGVRFSLDLTVNIIEVPVAKGADAFGALVRLATSTTIPYVVLLDHEGQRFYAHLQIPEGENRQPDHVYETTITVTEVTDTPVVVQQP